MYTCSNAFSSQHNLTLIAPHIALIEVQLLVHAEISLSYVKLRKHLMHNTAAAILSLLLHAAVNVLFSPLLNC
jgi:hypothetical protein